MPGDTDEIVEALALKISKLRLFKNGAGKMNLSILQTGGNALVVSQFTLAADTSRGNLKWSCISGQFCGIAKMHRVYVHAAFRISVWQKYAASGVLLSRAV